MYQKSDEYALENIFAPFIMLHCKTKILTQKLSALFFSRDLSQNIWKSSIFLRISCIEISMSDSAVEKKEKSSFCKSNFLIQSI